MNKQAKRLRGLFERPGIIRLVGAHNPLGAHLAERAGFDGVWSSGLEISTSYAVPDANILTMSEYLAVAAAMADAVAIPLVADCDTGYGNSNNVIHMVHKFETAGIAAVCIEDKLFPKVNSFVPGRQELAPIAEFVGKIMAAKNAQSGPDFMVIARIEALIAGWGQAEALKRAYAYAEAGADAVLIHAQSTTVAPIAEFAQRFDNRVPVVVVPTTYYTVTASELEALGVKMVIYANHGLRAAVTAMEQTLREILATGSSASVEPGIAPMKTIFELQGMPQFKRDEELYLRTGMPRTRAVILAAGDHMKEYSMSTIAADIPIAMLDVNGKPLLQRQVEALHQAGVGQATVVGGYKCEKINVEGIQRVENLDWQTTGEMASLMCTPTEDEGRTLVAYGDILFDTDALQRLLRSEADITLVVDRTYSDKHYAPHRRIDLVKVANPPPDTRRALHADTDNRMLKIGKELAPQDADCEFAGLALFSRQGFQRLVQVWHEVSEKPTYGRFHEAPSPSCASLTDVIQELVERGEVVNCLEVSSGWMEIHSFDDYRLACRLVAR